MLDLNVVKSIVALFKGVIDIIEGRTKVRRDSFDRTFKPLYDRMEVVAKEYYAAVSRASLLLTKSAPQYSDILDELEASRAAIIIARNGVLGEATAFHGRYAQSQDILRHDRLTSLYTALRKAFTTIFSPTKDFWSTRRP